MSKKSKIIGVSMVKFSKPGTNEPYEVMAAKAVRVALEDAGVDYWLIQQAYASYVYGDSTCGQTALYQVGMTGIPIINVNNTPTIRRTKGTLVTGCVSGDFISANAITEPGTGSDLAAIKTTAHGMLVMGFMVKRWRNGFLERIYGSFKSALPK